MKLVTSEEMREIDRKAIHEAGIPGVVLMENAGRAAAESVIEMAGKPPQGRRVTIFAGKGNNGGDGFVVARHLANRGLRVKVFLLGRKEETGGDAAINLKVISNMGIDVEELADEGLSRARVTAAVSDVVVDALLGTGFRGALTGLYRSVVELINESGRPVLSLDIPSGLDASSGRVEGGCVRASRTVTFGLPKLGLFLYPGRDYVGELVIADIGIPRSYLSDPTLKFNLITKEHTKALLPRRPRDTHKGDFGRVFVVAGSPGMTGAACLTSMAALRAGAGLVTLGVPKSLQDLVAAKLTEVMTRPLPETEDRTLGLAAQEAIEASLKAFNVLAMGPGLSTHSETAQLVRNVALVARVPVVMDADALNAMAGDRELLKLPSAPMVLTPHAQEMARLLGVPVEEIIADRVGHAMRAAAEWNKVVVLKGASTIVADPSGAIYVNPTGNPGMSTAGAGDVLTGVIAGLIAQGIQPLDAAISGVYLHGLAGDIAASSVGEMGLVAGDLMDALPKAFISVAGRAGDPPFES